MTITKNDDQATAQTPVERAFAIHQSIAACHAHIARGDGVHALTAALMLPCYEAGFRRIARSLDHAQARELRTSLDALHAPG